MRRKFFEAFAFAAIAMLAVAAPTIAGGHHEGNGHEGNGHNGHHGKRTCNGKFTGVTLRNVVVGPFDVCELSDSVVKGDVNVGFNGDFEATNTSIGGDITASRSQTIFLDPGSSVGGSVVTDRTAQVFVFDSSVDEGLNVTRSTDQVFLCNSEFGGTGISVQRSGPDILVGDRLNPGCPGNTVTDGNVIVTENSTDVELAVGDNTVHGLGSMFVFDNAGTAFGTSGEAVQGNEGGRTLACDGNAAPFVGSPNPSWAHYHGQCSA